MITQRHRTIGRADDVGEENSGEDSIRLRSLALAGEELLDLIEDRILVPRYGK